MSVQIGLANLLGVFLSVIVFVKLIRKRDYRLKLIAFFLLAFILVFFFMQRVSLPLWQNLPFMNYFQFPWRFLSLMILICSFLAASVFALVKSKIVVAGMIFLTFFLSISYAHPSYYMDRSDNYYVTRPNFIDGTNSIGNVFNTIWFKAKPVRINSKIDASTVKGKIISQKIGVNNYVFDLDLESDSRITINTAYFPGWQAFLDGKVSKVSITSTGLIELFVPKNVHMVRVSFGDTPVRQLSSIISLISLLGLITLFIRKWYIRNT